MTALLLAALLTGGVCQPSAPPHGLGVPLVEQERFSGVARRPNQLHVLIWAADEALSVEALVTPVVREVQAVNAPALRRGPVLTVESQDWRWVGDAPLVLRFQVNVASVGTFALARLMLREPSGRVFEHRIELEMFEDAAYADEDWRPQVAAMVRDIEARGDSFVSAAPPHALRACLAQRPYRLALDPGHNPRGDRGARGLSGQWEVAYNQRLVNALERELVEVEGLTLLHTRQPHESATLATRVARIRELQPDLVLSIHHDSIKPEHMSSQLVRGRRARVCPQRQGFSLYVPTSGAHGSPAYQLARYLSKAWIESGRPVGRFFASGEPEHGIYRGDGLYLIDRTVVPTVLAEVGYVCHPEEDRWLNGPQRVRQQARLMATAIQQHLWQHHCRGVELESPWIPRPADDSFVARRR